MIRLTVLAIALCSVFVAKSQVKNFIDLPHIEVGGNADTLVTPNEIFIRIILSEKDSRDRISIEELEQKLVSALNVLGLDAEKDLTTADIASNFKFYLLKSKDIVKTKMYMLKVTDATTAGKVFTKLEEVGISNTSIDRVNHSDLDNLKNMMRTKAIVDAKDRSVALTQPLNQTVGIAIHIIDADNNFSNQLQGKLMGIQIRGTNSNVNIERESARIEFEKIKVSASVSVKFILK